jgi:hypothetical protein
MKLNIEEMRKEPLRKERLAYNEKTRNRIDVEVYLIPLRAMYKVGKEGNDESSLFDDLKKAIDKFNYLEGKELDAKKLETSEKHHCSLCGTYIKEDNISVCNKCASDYQF